MQTQQQQIVYIRNKNVKKEIDNTKTRKRYGDFYEYICKEVGERINKVRDIEKILNMVKYQR